MNSRPFDNRDNDSEIEKPRVPRPRPGNGDGASEPVSPNVFWSNPLVRIVIFLFLYLVISTFVNRLINVIPWLSHVNISSPIIYGHPSILAFFPVEGIISALVALWLMKRSEGRTLWKSSGFVRQGVLVTVLIGLAAGAGIVLVSFGLAAVLERESRYPQTVMVSGFSSGLIYNLIVNLFRPMGNEIAFRGFVLQELEKRWGTFVALAGSSLLYCVFASWRSLYVLMLVHNSPRDPYIFYLLFEGLVSGVLFGSAYLLRRSLWLPIAIHVGFALSIYAIASTLRGVSFGYLFTFVEVVAAIWLIVLAIQKGQWKPGPGPREIWRSLRDNVVRIVEATDPGKQMEAVDVEAPASKRLRKARPRSTSR